MTAHESSSAQSNHQRRESDALHKILQIAHDAYAADQNNSAIVQIIQIAESVIKENE